MLQLRRTKRAVVTASAVVAALFGLLTSPATAQESPSGDVGVQIVGGQPATETHGASLLSFEGNQRCGAIKWGADDYVTAAHCLMRDPFPPDTTPGEVTGFQVRSGSLDRTDGGILSQAVRYGVHPSWNWGMSEIVGDVAYIQGDAPANTLNMPLAKKVTNGPVKLLGWGYHQYPPVGPPPVHLQEVSAWVIPGDECAGGGISAGELCLGLWPGTGPCFGDSGGPAVQLQAGRWVAIGVTSRGTGPGCANGNAIYTDLVYHRDRILGWSINLPSKPPADSTQPVPAAQEKVGVESIPEEWKKRQHWILQG